MEAGSTGLWWRYVGTGGRVIGIDHYGASGKAPELFKSSASPPSTFCRQYSLNDKRNDGMTLKVGINGYGRIGRNVLRALYEGGKRSQIQVVALNDLGDAKINAHLTRYDTVHGPFRGEIKTDGDALIVNGDRIKVLGTRSGQIAMGEPWGRHGNGVHRLVYQQEQGQHDR